MPWLLSTCFVRSARRWLRFFASERELSPIGLANTAWAALPPALIPTLHTANIESGPTAAHSAVRMQALETKGWRLDRVGMIVGLCLAVEFMAILERREQ